MNIDETITDLLLLSGVIAIGFLIAVAFYESLSTRDVLVRRMTRLARAISPRPWFVGLVYVATVAVGIPFLVVLWTLVLWIGLLTVGATERADSLGLIAVAIVAAARILAYVRQKTSHELAKAIPLALAFVLLTGGAVHLLDNLEVLFQAPDRPSLTDEMIVFLVGLEIGLRLLTDTSNALLGYVRRRRGIDSDLGVWRTLWAAVRRPLPQTVAVTDEPESGTDPGPST
jgi:hypothetical protein